MRGICTILRKITTTMTQELQFIPFESRADKGWAEAWALYEELLPPTANAGTPHGYDRAFGDPRLRSRRHLARRRVHRHPLPLERRGVPLRRASRRFAPPCAGRTWVRRPSRHSAGRPAASFWKSTLRRTTYPIRRLHFYQRLGLRRQSPRSISTLRSGSRSTPHQLDADEPSRAPHDTKKPAISRTSCGRRVLALFGARSPHAAPAAVKRRLRAALFTTLRPGIS